MRVVLTALSNPIEAQRAKDMADMLSDAGHKVRIMPQIDAFSSFEARADYFNMILNDNVDYILDLSGGELANGILPYIDYQAYGRSPALLVGYSDVSSVLNAVAWRSKKPTLLFQISGRENPGDVLEALELQDPQLFGIRWKRLSEEGLDFSSVDFVGGNMRCFLKLAGTPYFPELRGKVLFLESYSANKLQILSMLAQISQLKGFEKAEGICFGQFTELSKEEDVPSFLAWAARICGIDIPVYYSDQIGHSGDSKALWIG